MTKLLDALEARLESLACHDKSCAPPPIGVGGSKPGPGKGRLSPTDSGRVKPEAAADRWGAIIRAHGGQKAFEKMVSEMYTGDLGITDPDGREVRVELDRVFDYGLDIAVQGSFVVGTGVKIGRFTRNIGMSDDNDAVVATHGMLSIREKYRGLGIAQKFNDNALKGYDELGVDRIELEAALSTGPYAWARQGYRYDEANSTLSRHEWVGDRIEVMRQSVSNKREAGEISDTQAVAMDRELVDLKNASRRGADVQPIHVASIGEGDPAWSTRDGTSWIGKDSLMQWEGQNADVNRSWHGVYYLGRESTLNASALMSALQRRVESK
jgi:hypothetical protein